MLVSSLHASSQPVTKLTDPAGIVSNKLKATAKSNTAMLDQSYDGFPIVCPIKRR